MTAARAEAVQFEAVRSDGEPVPGGDFFLQLLDLAVLELDDLLATGTNQVVVMPLVRDVVVLCLGAEMAGLRQAGFAKQVERAVDRGQAQMRVFLRQLVVHLFRRDVFLLEERFEDEFTLARVLQLVFSEVRLQRLHLFHMFGHRVRQTIL